MQRAPALVIAAVILFERYEQKDKSGKNDRRERPNKKNRYYLREINASTEYLPLPNTNKVRYTNKYCKEASLSPNGSPL
jgi:hypothetical protein